MLIEKHNPKDIPITKSGAISSRFVLLKIKRHYGFPGLIEGVYSGRDGKWYAYGLCTDIPIELIKWWTEIPKELK